MKGKKENRIFVGGLTWDVTDKQLEDAFSLYGEVLFAQVALDKHTGRPRGFGFVTFADHWGMEEAIREVDGTELGDGFISVRKAYRNMRGDELGNGYDKGYSSGKGGSYRGGDRHVGRSKSFVGGRKTGQSAQECPTARGILQKIGAEENRIFVGGLSEDITVSQLTDAFGRFGDILGLQLIIDGNTGHPRGFGFVTFADQRGFKNAIKDMDGRVIGGQVISVAMAQPTMRVNDTWNGSFSDRNDVSRRGNKPLGRSDCAFCGRFGHWARECPVFDGMMSNVGEGENCIFVEGLSEDFSSFFSEDAFKHYGEVVAVQWIVDEADKWRSRGFCYVSFADQRGMKGAMKFMNGRELNGQFISVSKAQPTLKVNDTWNGFARYGDDYLLHDRGRYGGRDRLVGKSACLNSGRHGNWSQEYPSAGCRSVGERFSSRSNLSRGRGRGGSRHGNRDGDCYSDSDHVDIRYEGCDPCTRDNRYPITLHLSGGDGFGLEVSKQKPHNGYGKNRSYGRKGGPRSSGDSFLDTGLARNDNGSAADIEQITGLARYDNVSAADTEQITGLARYDNGSAADIEQITITINRVPNHSADIEQILNR